MITAATVFASPGAVLPLAAGVVAVVILLTWLLSLWLHDASIVDPVWGPAFIAVALVAALEGDGDIARRWLLLGLTTIWGVRLGVHLGRRKLADRTEDHRYSAMRDRHPHDFALWSLWAVFGLQGLLILIIALPVQVASGSHASLDWWSAPGIALFAFGLTFEAIGDEQLRRFRADPDNAGGVLDSGLWHYTRHPNYFGEFCIWWGIWLVVLPAGGTWWTFVGPGVLTFLLLRVSGVGRMEQDIERRRPAYAHYVRSTPSFVPFVRFRR